MLRSFENLFEETKKFVDNNSSITLFSAYIKVEALKKINASKNINRIIVRWELKDLCQKSSDFKELYNYCQTNNISLFRNTRIHLKALWTKENKILLGSSNITNKGVCGLPNGNFELNTILKSVSFEDICYLNSIINSSEYVNISLIERLEDLINTEIYTEVAYSTFPTTRSIDDDYLISQLPMFYDITNLYDSYKNLHLLDNEELLQIAHDISLYKIPSGLSKVEFYEKLKFSFNNHNFVKKFKESIVNHIDSRGDISRNQSFNFGNARRWFSQNTTTVPTPRGYELNELTNVLYNWICYFDPLFSHSIEGRYSDIIRYNPVF